MKFSTYFHKFFLYRKIFLKRGCYIIELNITLKNKQLCKQELPIKHNYIFEATYFFLT